MEGGALFPKWILTAVLDRREGRNGERKKEVIKRERNEMGIEGVVPKFPHKAPESAD